MSRILLFLFTICAVLNVHSQVFRNLSVKDRLSDLIVNSIYKDSVGYVWFGTGSTVERFDGVYLRRFSAPCVNEKEKEVNVVIGMPGREIWFGNNAGLWRITAEEKVERVAADRISGKVFALLHDGAGRVYVGTGNGLFIYEESGVTQILLEQNALSEANTIKGLALEGGNLWMATREGLYAMSVTTRAVKSYKPVSKDIPTSYHKIYIQKKTLYLGTSDSGIVSFSTENGRFDYYLGLDNITALSGDGKHTLYVGSNGGGIYFVSTEDKRIVKHIWHDAEIPDGLHSNSVYSLLVDDMDIIWVGLYQMGVDYTLYQRGLFEVYQHLPELNLRYASVRTIEKSAEGMLVGTRDGLFYVDEKRGIYKRFTSPKLRSQMIMCSCLFGGKFYIGTYGGGMYVLDPKTVTLSDFESDIRNPFIDGNVFSVTSDYENNLWIATSNGIFRYENGKLKSHYHSKNSRLPEENIYRIYFDSRHRGWVCADSELLLIEPSSERHITDKFPLGFINKKLIRDIYEDSCHNLYFLPDKGRLFVSDLALNRFREIDGTPLDGRNLQFMIEDDEHWLWIGSNDGLFRYDKGDNFIAYNFSDGIPTSVFLNCNPKKEADGTLWFGSSQGVLRTHPDKIKQSKKELYPLLITDVSVDDEQRYQVKDGKESRLSIGQIKEKLTFHFSGFTYTDPQYMVYEYKLEGKDKQWKVLSGASEKSYYGLSAGNYVFRLRRVGDEKSEIALRLSIASGISIYWIAFGIFLSVGITAYVYNGRKRWRGAEAVSVQEDSLPAAPLVQQEMPEVPGVTELPETSEAAEEPEVVQKYKSSNITDEECRELQERLKELMIAEKMYVNPELKVADLSHKLNVPAYKLSYLFNLYLNLSFYDYVNDYRIEEFKMLVDRGEHRSYTINTLMERCGFVSRTTFFRYFKKKMDGQTPSEYIKNRK
ncbi:two-component regulator propeller domain-containing protein [Phocaeicola sartorii]|uniref:two-component regulator propeller domain-containing protein n=1 Tax=Phocaeicola sartorii TaxID=671267 RepID=UPI003519A3B0